jgi:acetyl-CoA C-acetyltransferase
MGIIYSNCTKIRTAAIKGALDKINLDPNLIDEVFMGNVVQAGVDKLLQGSCIIRWFI